MIMNTLAADKSFMCGGRLGREKALQLLTEGDLIELGQMADNLRQHRHHESRVTFVVDRNVNYTNICQSRCRFCAFYRDQGAVDAYVLSSEAILDKVAELVEQGGTQLLLQGGLNPQIRIEFFESLFCAIKNRFPRVQVHSLSPAEILCIASASGLSVLDTLDRLKSSGLDSIPGGGAEILVDEVRQIISPNKIGWRQWADVMLAAADLGMPTTATMMFGCGESPEHIVDHLLRIRELKDQGASFTAFIPWTYQPGNTELGGRTATGVIGMRLDDDGQDEVIGMICVPKDSHDTVMVVSQHGYGKRTPLDDEDGNPIYRITNRGGKGVKTMNINEKTGKLVSIKNVNDDNDLMIINVSGIVIRLHVADISVMGRATQGVRLINLEKRNDEIASVCKVLTETEEDIDEGDVHDDVDNNMNEENNDIRPDET